MDFQGFTSTRSGRIGDAIKFASVVGPARRRRSHVSAFTLVEIMVVITIISLLAGAAVPTIVKVKRRSLATVVANDIRVFAAAYDTYAHEVGGWPAEVDAGIVPPEMANRVAASAWAKPAVIGGQYNWENGQSHSGTVYRAAIAISSTAVSPVVQDADLFEAIDAVIDDGNLATGNFRIGADDEPVFIVSP